MSICNLPVSAEDETTTLGTGINVLEIMELCGLVQVNKVLNEKTRVKEGDLSKWLILIGDGLTQNRITSLVDKLHDDSLSFRDYYTDSLVISKAMEKMFIGTGDLHEGGFSFLGMIFCSILRWIPSTLSIRPRLEENKRW